MNTTNNNPALDFVCYSHRSMGRERHALVAEEDIERSEWREAGGATRIGILSAGKRKKFIKKSWRKRKITYAIRDVGEEFATPMGNYVVGQSINLFPYATGVITTFENEKEIPVIEREVEINLTKEEVMGSIMGKSLENIAPQDNINAAKTEIIKAIEEIAEKEDVKLRNKDKEELANLSIMLLKKIGEEI